MSKGDTVSLVALTPEQFVQIMKKIGSTDADAEILKAHLAAGAPSNHDGTINLFDYAAWLVKEVENAEPE